MDLHNLILNTFVAFIGLAVLGYAVKAIWRLLRIFGGLLRAITLLVSSHGGPDPNAVATLRGQIVDARNWHATDGKFYAEFWLKAHDGLEQRYKLAGVHPEVRKGHQVTLVEYSGTLVAICNHSTGNEQWVAPGWLLSSLYPTGRMRRLIYWCLGLAIAYQLLKSNSPDYSDLFLFLVLVVLFVRTTTFLVVHIFTSTVRRAERLVAFSAFCNQATKCDKA